MSGAYTGDEVFFHHNGVPKVGKVLCKGKHGCTVDHEGTRHRLKWGQISGHKSRTAQHYSVEHDGDDGMIVKNQDGSRRYVSVPPEARSEQLALDASSKKNKAHSSPISDGVRRG